MISEHTTLTHDPWTINTCSCSLNPQHLHIIPESLALADDPWTRNTWSWSWTLNTCAWPLKWTDLMSFICQEVYQTKWYFLNQFFPQQTYTECCGKPFRVVENAFLFRLAFSCLCHIILSKAAFYHNLFNHLLIHTLLFMHVNHPCLARNHQSQSGSSGIRYKIRSDVWSLGICLVCNFYSC